MRPPIFRVQHDEIVVDSFAGGGGASTGIEMAIGRSPDIAINHNQEALAMHAVNHPTTRHLCGDVFDVDPRVACGGRKVGLLWASPDCTFFSSARGSKPFRDKNRARRRRGLAWVVVKWARLVRPRVIALENVREFAQWGPLGDDGLPDPDRRGVTFRKWKAEIENLGYRVEMRELRACDYGSPTVRKRLFLIARCDGEPIAWPHPSHGPGLPLAHRTAAECIQWELPCPSIFGRKKPLAEKTMARIARGIFRFVLGNGSAFIVPTTHHGDLRVHGLDEPIRTVTSANRGELALIAPTLIQTGYGEREGQAPRSLDLHKPLGTLMAGGQKHGLVAAFLAKHYGGHEATGSRLSEPIHTITTQDHHSLVTTHLSMLRGTCRSGQSLDKPAPAITAGGTHLSAVRAFLTRHNGTGGPEPLQLPLGTLTTKERFGLVTVHGVDYEIADIGFRMLGPRELFRAQGFPDSYVIDFVNPATGKRITKTSQIELCGNSVCPQVAASIVRENFVTERAEVA